MTLKPETDNLDKTPTRGGIGRKRRSREEVEDLIDALVEADFEALKKRVDDEEKKLDRALERANSESRLSTVQKS